MPAATATTRFVHALLALLICSAFAGPAAAQDWPMHAHDPQRTNAGPLAVEPPYSVTWVWPPPAQPDTPPTQLSPFAQPVVATVPTEPLSREDSLADTHSATADSKPPATATRMFIGTMHGEVWAIDAGTRATIWRSNIGGPVMNSLAVAGRHVFVAGGDGCVYAFDSADGVKLWQTDLGAPLTCSPLPADNKLFVAGRDGRAYALDALTGVVRWSTPLDAPAAGSCAWAGGTVFLATHAATAYALNDRDGEILWRKAMRGQDPWYAPVVTETAVCFRTRSAVHGPSDDGMEKVLRSLPQQTDAWPPKDWLLERAAITGHLSQPDEQSFFVFDRKTGEELFTPAITRVGGSDCPPWPVVTPAGVVLAHRRVRSTRMKGAMNMGSRYPLDFDELDIENGNRKPLAALPLNSDLSPRVKVFDMNRTHYATVGGAMIYFYHAELGCFGLDLKTGEAHGIVRPFATPTPVAEGTKTLFGESEDTAKAPTAPMNRYGDIASGVVIADGAMFINLPNAGCVVRIDGKGGKDAPTPAKTAAAAEPAPSSALQDDLPDLPERVSATRAVHDVLRPGDVPPAAEELQKQLVADIRDVLEAGPLAPAYYLAGSKHPTYLFDSPADAVWAICEALPFIPGDLHPKIRTYLQQHMKAHPLWEDSPLPADAGDRPEFFPITAENRGKVSSLSRLQEAKLRRLYALWLYADRTGDIGYIRENWPAIAGFARKGLQQVDDFGPTYSDLTGLIGLARLAILAEQDAIAANVIKDLARMADKLSDVEAFRQNFNERNRFVLAPNFIRMKDCPAALGMVLTDLTPAAVRLLDSQALAKHAAQIDRDLPHWFIGLGGPTYGEHVWADSCTMPPHIPAGYFQLHAWLGQTPPQQLARWIDAPCVRAGDWFRIRKLTAALTRYSAPTYKPLIPPNNDD